MGKDKLGYLILMFFLIYRTILITEDKRIKSVKIADLKDFVVKFFKTRVLKLAMFLYFLIDNNGGNLCTNN